MSNKYDDIINLPRPESKYPRMPRVNRAAQFSPFAALTGHEEAIQKTNTVLENQLRKEDSRDNDLSSEILERSFYHY